MSVNWVSIHDEVKKRHVLLVGLRRLYVRGRVTRPVRVRMKNGKN